MIFDRQAMGELVAREAVLDKEFWALSEKMNAAHATDKPWDEARLAEYHNLEAQHAQRQRELGVLRAEIGRMDSIDPGKAVERAANPLARFLRSGSNGLDEAERKIYMSGEETDAGSMFGAGTGVERFWLDGPEEAATPDALATSSFRPQAATASDATSGQELIQETVVPRPVETLAYYGGAEEMCYVFTTANGNEFRHPQFDEASVKGEILGAQNQSVAEKDLANFGVVTFTAKTGSSKGIDITREMVQDSVFDVARYAERVIRRRLGRIWNAEFTAGATSGAGNIVGLLGSSTDGVTTAGKEAITWEEMLDLVYTVEKAYRDGGEMGMGGFSAMRGGRVGYMMHESAEQVLRKLEDGDGRPLWIPAITAGAPNMIHGYPYVINQDLEKIVAAGGKKPVLFGNFSYYGIRKVQGIEVFRFFDSATAAKNTIRLLGFNRCYSAAMGAITSSKTTAIKILVNKS